MTTTKLAAALFAALTLGATVAPATSSASPRINGEPVGVFVSTYWTGGGMADFRAATR